MPSVFRPAWFLAIASPLFFARAQAAPTDYFRIDVVDDATGRGVPLVELKTTNETRYFTDSNGIAAIGDPELMGHKVYFSIKSDGYTYTKDMFGNAGAAFDVKPGARATIRLQRQNIAERLYRVTGAGIYRDSVLVGAPTPLDHPLMDGLVMGQDTVEAVPYNGKIFWLWGDTFRPAYPLGNFFTSAATSLPPGQGGLDPDKGVDLTYWVDDEGFSKKMIPLGGNKPVWMGGLFTLPDQTGRTRLFGSYAQVESDSKTLEAGLAVFNDASAQFDKVAAFDSILQPGGHPFRATVKGRSYLYFTPFQRVVADYAHITDPKTYEAFTPLVAGTNKKGADAQLERGADGKLVYGWKANTAVLGAGDDKSLIEKGVMAPDQALLQFRDIESGAPVQTVGGSVYWNNYLKRWVRITGETGGSASYLGEIWFAQADTPVGPWAYARKIVTHDNYTFYNSTQHPFFDQDGGRLIYFEGTYTTTYSSTKTPTPRYNYNQIMYRLALDDPRLMLPVPVYRLKNGEYVLRATLAARHAWPQVQSIPFYAMPAPGEGLVPVYAATANGVTRLQLTAPANARPLFYALPAQTQSANKAIVPIYETAGAAPTYSATPIENAAPLLRAWSNPSAIVALDEAVAEN